MQRTEINSWMRLPSFTVYWRSFLIFLYIKSVRTQLYQEYQTLIVGIFCGEAAEKRYNYTLTRLFM